MLLAGRQHVVVGFVLLDDEPHALDVIARVAPIALGRQVAEKQLVLQAKLYRCNPAGNLAGNKSFAPLE